MTKPSVVRFQRGIVLLEALVAMLLFTVAVLGIVGLQASMTKAQTSAKFRADASFLADQLIGVMWTDSAALATLANYRSASCDGYARCLDWKNRLANALPGSSSVVTVDTSNGNVTVQISWTAPHEGTHTYTTASAIRK